MWVRPVIVFHAEIAVPNGSARIPSLLLAPCHGSTRPCLPRGRPSESPQSYALFFRFRSEHGAVLVTLFCGPAIDTATKIVSWSAAAARPFSASEMATDDVEIITHKVTQLGSNKIGGLMLGGKGAGPATVSAATPLQQTASAKSPS